MEEQKLYNAINSNVIVPLLQGDVDKAHKAFEKLRESSPTNPMIHYGRAIIAHHRGDLVDAELEYKTAISLSKPKLDLYVNYVVLLQNQGRYKDSLRIAKAAFKLSPKEERVIVPYLTALLDTARTDEALQLIQGLDQSLRVSKKILLAEAACHRHDGRPEDAIAILNQLMVKHSQDVIVRRMMADVVGDYDSRAAIPIYEEAERIALSTRKDGALAAVKWNMSLHLLRLREFEKGWHSYEFGLSKDVGTLGRKLAVKLRRIPRLEDSSGPTNSRRWLLLIVEQGIGDQIIFFSALKDLLAEFSDVAILCEPRMMPIIERSFPKLQLLSPGIVEYLDDNDGPFFAYLPLGSIMNRYRKSQASFLSERSPYLVVDQVGFKRFKSKLLEYSKGRTVVGISWKGGFWENQKRNKSIGLEEWEPLLRRDALFVNLQYGDCRADLEWAEKMGLNILSFPDLNFKDDLDSWLSLACACDGIVSISTSIVHFAGAAGQKVVVLLPETQGPYIWGVQDRRSIIYRNVEVLRAKGSESLRTLIETAASRIKGPAG